MKKNMRKVAALGLCVALGATMLTACGGSKGESASGGKTELNFGIWDENQRPAMEKMVKAYEKENSDVKINIQLTPYKGGEYWTKLEAAASGGKAPDVFWLNVLHLDSYVEGGILDDLTDAYSSIVTALPFGRVYLNTIISTVVTTVVQVLFCSMAAYAFARIEFPFKNAIFVLVLSVLMVPGQIFLIPQYRIVQSLGLLDTIPALFLPNLFSAFGTFLLRQFFMSLPKELEEAALLDGCNRFQIFGRIMLPLTKAGIVSLVIFTAKFAWNDFMWPLIVNTSMDKMTLGPALSTLQGQYTTKYPMQMAGAVMAVIPIIVLFFIFQKQFIEGVAQSGIKG